MPGNFWARSSWATDEPTVPKPSRATRVVVAAVLFDERGAVLVAMGRPFSFMLVD